MVTKISSIIESLKSLTLLEATELVKEIEKFLMLVPQRKLVFQLQLTLRLRQARYHKLQKKRHLLM